MIVRICVPHLIIIIKLEVWPVCHCLGLDHETMVCAVCLFIFLWKKWLHLCYIITASDGTQSLSNEIVSLLHKSIDTSLFITILCASFTQVTWPDLYSPTNCNATFPAYPWKCRQDTNNFHKWRPFNRVRWPASVTSDRQIKLGWWWWWW